MAVATTTFTNPTKTYAESGYFGAIKGAVTGFFTGILPGAIGGLVTALAPALAVGGIAAIAGFVSPHITSNLVAGLPEWLGGKELSSFILGQGETASQFMASFTGGAKSFLVGGGLTLAGGSAIGAATGAMAGVALGAGAGAGLGILSADDKIRYKSDLYARQKKAAKDNMTVALAGEYNKGMQENAVGIYQAGVADAMQHVQASIAPVLVKQGYDQGYAAGVLAGRQKSKSANPDMLVNNSESLDTGGADWSKQCASKNSGGVHTVAKDAVAVTELGKNT